MKTSYLFLLLSLSFFSERLWAQAGCTDPMADNYNASATVDNGSCTYSISLTNTKTLPGTLDETSGLSYTDGKLWTILDSDNPTSIHRIDPANGSILQTVNVTNATNTDWEDITADANYIYVGDFGNNGNGNRTNLRIVRISKASITSAATVNVTADFINFSYQDQVIGGGPAQNNFDCESFFIKDNVLHLFSKNWINGHTRHYMLSSTPGTYSIAPVEELDVAGLITSADISPNGKNIVLIGYTINKVYLFMYILNGFTGTNYFGGNHKRLEMGISVSVGQTEGVAFMNNSSGYVSSERINSSPFFVSPRLFNFSIAGQIALPVDLTFFNVSYKNPEVDLTWETATEINSEFFAIERSSDGTSFTEIAKVPATGNSNTRISYHFSDTKPVSGNNYYRLRQVDKDGAASLSTIKAIRTNGAAGKLTAYAGTGPAGRLVIDYGSPVAGGITYQLVSMNGSIVRNGNLQTQKQSIDVGGIMSGGYIVRLSDGRSVRLVLK